MSRAPAVQAATHASILPSTQITVNIVAVRIALMVPSTLCGGDTMLNREGNRIRYPELSNPPTLEEALQYTWLVLRLCAADDPDWIVELARSVLRQRRRRPYRSL